MLDRDIDPRPYAFARILVGLASLAMTYEWQHILRRAASGDYLQMPAFEWVPIVSETAVTGLLIVALAAAAGMVLGVWPRLAAGVMAGIVVVVLLLEQQAYSNHLVLLGCFATLLTLAQTDRAWTLVGRRPGALVPLWPGLLMMTLVSTVYFWTALAKVNSEFLSGDVLGNSLRSGLPFPDSLLPALAVASIATEMFLAVALWVRPLRRTAYVIGAALHVSIVLILSSPFPLVAFALLMVSGYVMFLAEDLDREGPRTVVWDSYCSFCKRWVAIFKTIDLFGVHRFVGSAEEGAFDDPRVTPDLALEALQLVSRERHEQGFDAVRRVFEASPLTFWAAPVLGLPPARKVGHAAYRRVAARRTCKLPVSR